MLINLYSDLYLLSFNSEYRKLIAIFPINSVCKMEGYMQSLQRKPWLPIFGTCMIYKPTFQAFTRRTSFYKKLNI